MRDSSFLNTIISKVGIYEMKQKQLCFLSLQENVAKCNHVPERGAVKLCIPQFLCFEDRKRWLQ
jgi:hypothetical protein